MWIEQRNASGVFYVSFCCYKHSFIKQKRVSVVQLFRVVKQNRFSITLVIEQCGCFWRSLRIIANSRTKYIAYVEIIFVFLFSSHYHCVNKQFFAFICETSEWKQRNKTFVLMIPSIEWTRIVCVFFVFILHQQVLFPIFIFISFLFQCSDKKKQEEEKLHEPKAGYFFFCSKKRSSDQKEKGGSECFMMKKAVFAHCELN